MERLAMTLPEELCEKNYQYPAQLLRDREKIMRFDGSDDIHIPVPLTECERTLFMAQYAVAKALHLACSDKTLIRIARLGIPETGFSRSILKTARSIRYGELEKGDIELKADELGVYEIIFPLDPAKMKAAAEAERQILEDHSLTTV